MGPINTKFSKIFIKTESYDTIYIFKNYFTTVFSVFNNGIQTDSYGPFGLRGREGE